MWVRCLPFLSAAPEYVVQSDRNHPTYAEVLHSAAEEPAFSKDLLDEQRGSRKFSELVLETYSQQGDETVVFQGIRFESLEETNFW